MIAIYELQDVRPLVDLYVYSYLRTCSAYDSSIKAMGFDEIRVRYRQNRRDALRSIVTRRLKENEELDFIEEIASKQIPKMHQKAFIEDVIEDLELLDVTRLFGLGITEEQLAEWKKRRHKEMD